MNSDRKLASCEGKARFTSFELAAKAARRKPRGRDAARNAYHCRFCDGYHVGTSTPRRQQRPTLMDDLA